nr:response regulator [Nitrosomonas nitrosa]
MLQPTIFIVDDDPSVRKSLSRLIQSHGRQALEFPSAEAFLQQHPPERPGCLILDLSMPGLDGLALQKELEAANILLPIIFITGHGTIPSSVQAMKAGAVDFLTKPVGQDVLMRAIEAALEKDHLARQNRAEIASIEARLAALTPREREVMTYVVSGKVNKQIAAALGTVEKTIKVHRSRLMQKLGVTSVAQLVKMAGRVGIVGPS